MATPGWRTSLVVQALEPRHGKTVPVVVGLIETAFGGIQLALRVGENGKPIILPLQAARQLAANVLELMTERFRITGEAVGGDGQ